VTIRAKEAGAFAREASDYQNARAAVPDGQALTVLHIAAEITTVTSGTGSSPDSTISLAIGYGRTAATYFKHEPPTPVELEAAIQAVEDEVTKARHLIPAGSRLYTALATLQPIAQSSGFAELTQGALSLEAIEGVFDRLTAVTLGTPATHAEIPTGASFAATLLILREFMHHLRFPSVSVLE